MKNFKPTHLSKYSYIFLLVIGVFQLLNTSLALADECDSLASKKSDPERLSEAVDLNKYSEKQIKKAIMACKNSLLRNPKNAHYVHLLAYVTRDYDLYQKAYELGYADSAFVLFKREWELALKNNESSQYEKAINYLAKAVSDGHPNAKVAQFKIYENSITSEDSKILNMLSTAFNDERFKQLNFDKSLLRDLALNLLPVKKQTLNPDIAVSAQEILDDYFPNGPDAKYLAENDKRELVQDTNKYPFSASGRLYTFKKDGSGPIAACSASIIGNRKTIATNAHCVTEENTELSKNFSYYFVPQNKGLEGGQKDGIVYVDDIKAHGIPAEVYDTGQNIVHQEFNLRKIQKIKYQPKWVGDDDWAVFNLKENVDISIRPLSVMTNNMFEEFYNGKYINFTFLVVGFPYDVNFGMKMVLSYGCGLKPDWRYQDDRLLISETRCISYAGSSGSPLLLKNNKTNTIAMIGLVNRGNGTESRCIKNRSDPYCFSLIVVSKDLNESILNKVIEDGI